MQGILLFGMLLLLCKCTVASSINKYKDSKISHIIPAATVSHSDDRLNLASNLHGKSENSKTDHSAEKRKISNHDILRSLGLSKLTIPPSHHRKRLAIESRHHARPDDSHMFIIKLPPNPVYYTNTRSAHDKNSIEDKNKKVSVDFKSNGKPGRIYHWNLPVLKKMFSSTESKEDRHTNSRHTNDIDLIDIKHIPTWSKPWENETIEKTFRKTNHQLDNEVNYKSHGPSYYAPRPKKSHNSVHKYFPGNGKPKSFYIMNKKNQKPHYQTLLP